MARNGRALNWADIQRFHDTGHDRDACLERFNFRLSAWYKAIRRGALRTTLQKKTVDWLSIQRYYDAGHTYAECRKQFQFSAGAWGKAAKRGEIKTRSPRWPLERLLAESKSRTSIKRRLLDAGLLKNKCDECGLTTWRGRPISIHLDHRNGVRDDHRLENLRMLCPNCHSQTSTFGVKNRKQWPGLRRMRLVSRVV